MPSKPTSTRNSRRSLGCEPKYVGSSLVELVLLLVVIGVLMTVSMKVVGNAVAVHQVAVSSVVDVRSAEAIEQRLRTDLKRCNQVTPATGTLLVLTIDEHQSIKYGIPPANPEELIRQVLVDNQQQAIDRWQLPHPLNLTLKTEVTATGRPLARVGIESRSPAGDARWIDIEVVEVCDGE